MTAAAVSFNPRVMPWAGVPEDDARFRRIIQRTVGVCLLIFLIVPWLPVRQPDRTAPAELPPRLAKLVLETPPPPPPPPKVQEKPKDAAEAAVPQAKPDQAKPIPAKPDPVKMKQPIPEARVPQANKPPGEIEGARRKAAGVGLLAMKDQLQELSGAPMAVQLKPDIKQGPGVGSGVGVGVGAGTEAGLPDRAMITSNATGGSGGINTAGYSRNTGGGGLAGRSTTLVAGVAGGGGGGGKGSAAGSGTGNGTGAGGTVQRGNSGKAARSIEEIRLVFERNKGAIYAIYNRALREDPGLQGKVVLSLKISPSGQLVDCRIVSSELKSPELESKLLARIKQFEFGARDVDQIDITYPLDFLPS